MFGFEDTELFSCCVCRQSFATERPEPGAPDLRPVSLPCGHTICARCGVEGQRRETGCPLRCAWRGSDVMCPRRWPLAYHYMQDIAAARALLPWLPAAAAEAMGAAEQSGATANGCAPAGLQRAPTLRRPELGGNLSQFVFVDSPAMGESSHVHTVKIVLSRAGVATLHGVVASRFLQSCACVGALSGDGATATADAAARRGGSDRAADSAAAAAYFRHPASAEAELESALRVTLLSLQAPHSALTRGAMAETAEMLLRTMYGAGREFATAVRFVGHHAAVLQVRLTWSPTTHLWAHELALQLGGARTHLRTPADVDAAHACGLFEGRVSDLPAPPPATPAAECPSCGDDGAAASGECKGAGKAGKADSVDLDAVGKRVVTRARSTPLRSPRVAACAGEVASDVQLGRGKRRRVARVRD